MIVNERAGVYSAQHVTGPTHNLLRLKLVRGFQPDFDVSVLPPVGTCRHHEGLTADEVRPFIRSGVARANEMLGTDFGVAHAEVIENDSRPVVVYAFIARKIIEAAAGRLTS